MCFDLYRLHREKLDLVVKFLEVNIQIPSIILLDMQYSMILSISTKCGKNQLSAYIGTIFEEQENKQEKARNRYKKQEQTRIKTRK